MDEVVRHDGFLARYGGEEFAIIVSQKSAQAIRALAEEVRHAIDSRPLKHLKKELHVTASLGAAWMPDPSPSVNPKELIKQADQQLYRAKHAGRNRVEM